MKKESYLAHMLRGDLEPVTRDGRGYWTVVEPRDARSESQRLFTEVTFMSGTAIAIKFSDIESDAIAYLENVTFSKAKARLALQLYEPGKEYLQEIMSNDLQATYKSLGDDYIQQQLLNGLTNIRRADPIGYRNKGIDTKGFCQLLGISEESYLFNASILLEDSLVAEGEGGISTGAICVTSSGVRKLNESQSNKIVSPSPSAIDATRITRTFEHEYDVSLSFAGEDRAIAEDLATRLKNKGIRVFYDAFEQNALWGTNLYEYLTKIYSESSRFCVLLLSKHYAEKSWTNHERRSAQARALREGGEYILPVRIDDTKIPGLLETVGYISLDRTSVEECIFRPIVTGHFVFS